MGRRPKEIIDQYSTSKKKKDYANKIISEYTQKLNSRISGSRLGNSIKELV